jgi:hypothetical protein
MKPMPASIEKFIKASCLWHEAILCPSDVIS